MPIVGIMEPKIYKPFPSFFNYKLSSADQDKFQAPKFGMFFETVKFPEKNIELSEKDKTRWYENLGKPGYRKMKTVNLEIGNVNLEEK